MQHYNILLTKPWENNGFRVVFKPCCLMGQYDINFKWDIDFPKVNWNETDIVIMHTQDFLSPALSELKSIENHFKEHSKQVIVIYWNIGLDKLYNGPLNLIHFPTHSYELLNNLEDKLWAQPTEESRKYKWQCLNGIPKQHRKIVANWLTENMDPSTGILSLGNIIELEKSPYSNYNYDNSYNWTTLEHVYRNCDINIVTESLYHESPGIISEKTVMAFLAEQVPIVIGHKGVVRECQDLGFDMFEDIVDIRYDQVDNFLRHRFALTSNRSLLIDGIDRSKLAHRLANNKQRLFALRSKWIDDYFTASDVLGKKIAIG